MDRLRMGLHLIILTKSKTGILLKKEQERQECSRSYMHCSTKTSHLYLLF
jgi:hypothetical protein